MSGDPSRVTFLQQLRRSAILQCSYAHVEYTRVGHPALRFEALYVCAVLVSCVRDVHVLVSGDKIVPSYEKGLLLIYPDGCTVLASTHLFCVQVVQLGKETVLLLLQNNPQQPMVLRWAIYRCYTGPVQVANGYFQAMAAVFNNSREGTSNHR